MAYARPITEQSRYEVYDLEGDFLGFTYSKGAEFFAYLSMTGCYTRFSTSPVEGLVFTQRAEGAWSESITGAYNTIV
jgi:hypothetical protein